jgi:hypothetical protein
MTELPRNETSDINIIHDIVKRGDLKELQKKVQRAK